MSLFRRLMVVLGAGGAGGLPEYRKNVNIFSAYNLCSSVSHEHLVAVVGSTYTVSVMVVELVASLSDAVIGLYLIENPKLVALLASVYDLSTAVT